jgi:hypothetical protein
MEYFPTSQRRRFIVWIAGSLLLAAIAWEAVQIYLEWRFPIVDYCMSRDQIAAVWQLRSQFGSMFGAAALIFSTLTVAFAIYATYQQAHEMDTRNQFKKWEANYNYLLNAKKYLAEQDRVIELHGLDPGIYQKLDVTPQQVAYVLIDLEAAELYYLMDGKPIDEDLKPTGYRKHLLKQPVYRKIVKEIIVPGKMLGESPFSRFIEKCVAD